VIRLFTTYFSEEMWEAHAVAGEVSLEELCDAFHFLVEICLRAGVTPTAVFANQRSVMNGEMGSAMGRLLYTLRMRPWKQKPAPADLFTIRSAVVRLFAFFLEHVHDCGFSEEQLLNGYFKKAVTNQQRIDAGV
jgi:dimeric dUTPase (all-alpha-NTP-PPase superfamily)